MPRKIETIIRYVSVYNKIQANYAFAEVPKWSFAVFKKKTNLQSESQFRLAKAIARDKGLQQEINTYLSSKKIPKNIIKPITVKQYLPKTTRLPTITQAFTRFIKKTPKFTTIKGKAFTVKSTATRFKTDARRQLRNALKTAKRETQKYSGKQIKITIKSDIIPDRKLDKDFRELSERTYQTKVRVFKDDLEFDIDDLIDSIDEYIAKYEPEGSVVITVSVVNYTI